MGAQGIRHLDIDDLERISRFRKAGYGGSVSDALYDLRITNTVLSDRFRPLVFGTQLVGRALPVKLHSLVQDRIKVGERAVDDKSRYIDGEHPQKRLMRTIKESPDGSILCFDCGGDVQPAHFGELSCKLAQANGCHGMLLAGNIRDTRYVAQMSDFTVFSFGSRPNWYGGWIITEINRPIYLPGHLTHYVPVVPGDFIFGDGDGVLVIPKDLVDEVLLRVECTYEKENAQRKQIEEGLSIDDVYDRFGVL